MIKNIRTMIAYYKPYRLTFFMDMFCTLIAAGITLAIPLIARYILYNVINLNKEEGYPLIIIFGLILLSLLVVEYFCNFFMGYYGHIIGSKMEYDMRKEIFNHYQKLSLSFYDNQKVGQLLSRVTSDLFEISELLHHGPEDLLVSIIKLFGSTIILVIINPMLGVLAFIFIPFMSIFAVYYNKRMKIAFKKNKEKLAVINEILEDSLSGVRVVKAFSSEKREEEKFKKGSRDYVDSKKVAYKHLGGFYASLTACTTFVTIIVVIGGATLIFNNKLNQTDLITFFMYLPNLTSPILKLVAFTEQFQNGYGGFERFREMMSVPVDIKEVENPIVLSNIEGNIEFRNVSFSYDKNEEEVIKNLNLKINKGEYLALVGSSGAGKTTLFSLLPRFYDTDMGDIFIDGKNIKEVTLSSLRKSIGIVAQDVYLFAGSIKDNIRYGKENATDAEIIEAAKASGAHEFIMKLPDGYDSYIGQRGVKLSGGQKQRISIARVFLKNPPILIFDEATSALDNESERMVQESLERLAKNRTTLVIAHRLSTIKNADRIVVLEKDGIKEEGSHDELINREGIYKELYNMQFN